MAEFTSVRHAIAHYAACRKGPQIAQQDSRYGCKVQRSRHTSNSWLVVGACLRLAGVKAGSRGEERLFEWAQDPSAPRPEKLYRAVLRVLKASGVYERLPAITPIAQKFPRPLDLEVIAGSVSGDVGKENP